MLQGFESWTLLASIFIETFAAFHYAIASATAKVRSSALSSGA